MRIKEYKRPKPIWLMVSAFLMMSLSCHSLFGQTGSITGKVTDIVTNDPLPGVTVLVEGTNIATATGGDGSFRINAQQGQILIFTYMSYETLRLPVGVATNMEVAMTQSAQSIETVVVTTGYGGLMAKADALGAVAQVSASDIEKRVPTNIFDAMRGTMAGVRITSNSGAPGAPMSVRVRGITTLEDEGVAPLYVVDGFIVDDIANINPNDVENINVLKDAASAAIYGARAAAGVIMVTTKAGKPGKMKITVAFNQKFGFISNTLPQVNRREADIAYNTIFSYSDRDQFAWLATATDSLGISNQTSNYYQDLISRMGTTSQVDVSARGGSNTVRYSVSAGYTGEQGVILNSRNQRATFRSKVDYIPNKVVTLTTNVALTYTDKNAVDDGSVYFNATRRMPQTWIYYPTDGSYVGGWASYPNNGKRNPILEIYERKDNQKRYRGDINQQVLVNILPELSFTGNAKVNFWYDERTRYTSPWIQTNKAEFDKGNNSLTLNDRIFQNYSLEGFFNYSKKFAENHSLAAMLGSSIEYEGTKSTETGGTFLADPTLEVPQWTGTLRAPSVTGPESSIASVFARASYDYKKRYMISAVLRYDGSSRFGPDRRWGLFPSVQLGWRFSDHLKLIRGVDGWLHDAKLRVSYGITGNDRIGEYDHLPLYGGDLSAGYNGAVGITQSGVLGNPNLHWEQTAEFDAGMDLSFFKGRLTLEADYYIQNTSGLLDSELLPSELGYTSRRVNMGTVRNKGWEITVMGYPVETKDWTWSTSIAWSRNRNTVIDLAGGENRRILDTHWLAEEGRPAGLFYGFKQLGVYAYDVNNAYTADFSERLNPVFQRDEFGNVMFTGEQPIVLGYAYRDGSPYRGTPKKLKLATVDALGGDVIWDDYNRDGVIDDNDKQVLGSGHPDWQMSWSNNIRWKDLSLSFTFYYSRGGLIYNAMLHQLTSFGDNTSAPDPRPVLQGWRFQGHLTDWHIPGSGSQNGRNTQQNGRQLSSFYLEDGSFIRLQDLRLAYDFDKKMISKLKLTQLQLYVFGTNLLTWTNYRGYDPEVGGGNVLTPGRDGGRYPKQRQVGFGLTIGF